MAYTIRPALYKWCWTVQNTHFTDINDTVEDCSLLTTLLSFRLFDMLLIAKYSLVSWTIALSTSSALAHPLFNGRIVARADELLSEYDYVVVGGGASGLTVANHLSEQPGKS